MRRTLGIVGLLAIATVAIAVPGSERRAALPVAERAAKPTVELSGRLAGIGADITVMADDPMLLRQQELTRNQPIARVPADAAAASGPQIRVIELDPAPAESVVNPTKNFLYEDLTNRETQTAARDNTLDAAARSAQVERIRRAAAAKAAQ